MYRADIKFIQSILPEYWSVIQGSQGIRCDNTQEVEPIKKYIDRIAKHFKKRLTEITHHDIEYEGNQAMTIHVSAKKPPKFKDIPWNSNEIGGVMMGTSHQKFFVAELGGFVMVHVLARSGDHPVSSYGLRKGKTWVIEECSKDEILQKMEEKGYCLDWNQDDPRLVIVKYKKKSIIRSIRDSIK